MSIYVWAIILIAYIAQNQSQNNNPYYVPNPDYDPPDPLKLDYQYTLLFNLGKLGNISKILFPMMIFIVRLSDP